MAPEFVARPGGSRWQSAPPTGGSRWNRALPGGSADMSFSGNPGKPKTSAALIYGGRQSSLDPAAASGRRPCRPVRKECGRGIPFWREVRYNISLEDKTMMFE